MAGTRGYSKAFGLRLFAAFAVSASLWLTASAYAQQKPPLQADPDAAKANQPGVDRSGARV